MSNRGIALRLGARLGLAALRQRTRVSLTLGSGFGAVGLALALGITATSGVASVCDGASGECAVRRTGTLFAVLVLPSLAVLVVTVRAGVVRRLPQYSRFNALGLSRRTVLTTAAVEALTVAAPGVVVGTAVGTLLLALVLGTTSAQGLAAVASATLACTALVVVLSTSLSLSLGETQLLRRIRVASEAGGRIAAAIWTGSTVVLVALAATEGTSEAARAAWRSSLWLVCAVVSVLTLPAMVTVAIRSGGAILARIGDRSLTWRIAGRQMQWHPASLTRAAQVLAVAAAIAVAAQYVWIAVAATPAIDTVLRAQHEGPNLLVIGASTPQSQPPPLPDYVTASAPYEFANCVDGKCLVFVAPCELIAKIARETPAECGPGTLFRTPDATGDAPLGQQVDFNGEPELRATLSSDLTVGRIGPLASFFADQSVTDIVTPDAFVHREPVAAYNWIVLAPPGVTGADLLGGESEGVWSQAAGLSPDQIAEVDGLRQQIYAVAVLALAAALIGLIVFSFDNYTERYRMSQRWLRFGIPERVGSRSYLVGQLLSGLVAAVLGCVTAAAIAWDLGYTTVASVVSGSRAQPVGVAVVLSLAIVLVNAVAMAVGVRLVKERTHVH